MTADKNQVALDALEKINAAIMTASGTFCGYEILHMAKNPPDLEKAKRNGDMDKMLLALVPDIDLVRQALQSLTAPSAGVDVSPMGDTSGAPEWHKDIPEAVAFVEKQSIETLERAITACQDWDVAGMVHEGLVTDMATAYLQNRKALTSIPDMREAWLPTEVTVDELAKILDTKFGSSFPGIEYLAGYIGPFLAEQFANGLRIKAAPKGGKL